MDHLHLMTGSSVPRYGYRISASGDERQTCRLGAQVGSPVNSRSVAFTGLISHRPDVLRLRVKLPLNLRVERDDADFIVSDSLFGIYGEGGDAFAALEDYQSALMDYFILLYDKRETSRENADLYSTVSQYLEVVSPEHPLFF